MLVSLDNNFPLVSLLAKTNSHCVYNAFYNVCDKDLKCPYHQNFYFPI